MKAPEWFEWATSIVPLTETRSVDGCVIHSLHWGTRGLPGLVLVHGGAAHAHWWRFVAPFFTAEYDVVALDLSGHGESAWRERYQLEGWAAEIEAVIGDARFAQKPVVVGHSLGGLVTITAAAVHGESMAGAIIVDSVPKFGAKHEQRGEAEVRAPKVYPTLHEAMAHFRLLPSQPASHNPFIFEFIARTSLTQTAQGWSWKFDPRIITGLALENMQAHAASVKCRVGVIRGELSKILTLEGTQLLSSWLGHRAPIIEIPRAHHHLMIDEPIAFVSALRALLADWRHSTPR